MINGSNDRPDALRDRVLEELMDSFDEELEMEIDEGNGGR
jgi:hypothetical protein